jgi:hypothetical protein
MIFSENSCCGAGVVLDEPSRRLPLAEKFARHVSPLTTTVYTHPSDQELW